MTARASTRSVEQVRGAVRTNRLWYHTMELAPGVVTPGWFDLRPIVDRMPWPDVRGLRCLDVGTYDGFLAFELERRGAREVVATDLEDHSRWDWPVAARGLGPERLAALAGERKGRGFETAKEALGFTVERIELSVYDLSRERVGTFDVVVCGSLLLHLKDPVGALEAIRSVCTGALLSAEQVDITLTLLGPHRSLARFRGGDRLQWWIPNAAGHRRMLESAGWRVEGSSRPYAIPLGPGHRAVRRYARGRAVAPPAGRRAIRTLQRTLAGGAGVPHMAVLARPRDLGSQFVDGRTSARASPGHAEPGAGLSDRVAALDWYHTMELAPEIVTPGWFDTRGVPDRLPLPGSLAGRRCLDVGTFDGFWAFEMERRGADEVVAIDVLNPAEWDWPTGSRPDTVVQIGRRKAGGAGFELAREALGSAVRRMERSVYELHPEEDGRFDFVYLGSLLLHLRNPIRALERVRGVCSGELLLVDAIDPALALLPARAAVARLDGIGRPWWWRPNPGGLVRMVESAGFRATRSVGRIDIPVGRGHPAHSRRLRSVFRDRPRLEALLTAARGDPHAVVIARPE